MGSRPRFGSWILKAGLVLQAICGMSVILRLIRSSGGTAIGRPDGPPRHDDKIAVLIPVLNEEARIEACLEAVTKLRAVESVLVIDGGSSDRTVELARGFEGDDDQIRVIEAGQSPPEWNGKIWGLESGLNRLSDDIEWILTIDADVSVDRSLAEAMLEKAHDVRADLLSVAARQRVRGVLLGAIHPSMLTTLVYRFGIPGHVAGNLRGVQANGQCFLIRRAALEACGGFREVRTSFCEDVTLARLLAESGYRVGFHEAGDLVTTEMYGSAGAAWNGWSRSLPTRDRYFGSWGWSTLVEVLLAQGLALPSLFAFLASSRLRRSKWGIVPLVIATTRIGTLAGTRRAYSDIEWSYWLSPLADLPVSLRVLIAATQRNYTWRGQPLIRGE